MNARLRDRLSEDAEKLRSMTLSQKLRFIATYYGLWIGGIVCAVALIAYLAIHIAAGAPEYWLYAVFTNTRAEAGNGSALWTDFTKSAGCDPGEKRVEFDAASYFDYTRNQARGNAYYNAFVTLADTGTLDLITMEPEQLAALGQSGRLLDWNMESCAALREKYAGRLIWYQPPEGAEQTGPIPVGVDISDSLLVTKYKLYADGCALGISAQSGRLDAVARFLSFILEEG